MLGRPSAPLEREAPGKTPKNTPPLPARTIGRPPADIYVPPAAAHPKSPKGSNFSIHFATSRRSSSLASLLCSALRRVGQERRRRIDANGGGGGGEGDVRGGGGAGGGDEQGARGVPVLRRPRGGHRRGEQAPHPLPPALPQEQAQVLLHPLPATPRHSLQLARSSRCPARSTSVASCTDRVIS